MAERKGGEVRVPAVARVRFAPLVGHHGWSRGEGGGGAGGGGEHER